MLLSDLSPTEFARRLCSVGLTLRTGPFVFRIFSPVPSVAEGLRLLYATNQLAADDEFVDFDVRLEWAHGLRRWLRPQVRFVFDGESPFEPLPADHAYPLLEWAMNWCISSHAHQGLLLHAAAIERQGLAVILPAPPGSGKSTLCAGLVSRNWRLLSDEVAMISLADGGVTALARPVSLKNESIDVIRRFAPQAVINRVSHGTSKGSVTHMRAPVEHVSRVDERARPRWVVFPRYVAGAAPMMKSRPKAESMLELGRNAFNYMVLGHRGFDALGDLVSACDCYDFHYSDLDDAMVAFDELLEQAI
ncbi:MAG: HprK-related kinase A [Polaromonas sp.]